MKLDKTEKDGVQIKKDGLKMGPAAYFPLESTMGSLCGNINPIQKGEEVIHGLDFNQRPVKSQEMTKRRWMWDEKKNSK